RNHEETEEEEENGEQRRLESSYKEPKLLQGNIKSTLKRDSFQDPKASQINTQVTFGLGACQVPNVVHSSKA
ncbi:hypothetical protein PIB30_080664, partial [Stylosanthes scabra]|nr:hypothetical protein [Stylosanthes scabra]